MTTPAERPASRRLATPRRGDAGFTLIELLVVMIIIGILAAIAVPVFLNQRQSARDTAVKSDLHVLALQEHTALVATGSFATVEAIDPTYRTSDDVVVSVLWATASDFCLVGTSRSSTKAAPGSPASSMGIDTRVFIQDSSSSATELTAANWTTSCANTGPSGTTVSGWLDRTGYHAGVPTW